MAPTERGKPRQGAAARGCRCCAAAPRPATRSHLAEPPETHERPVGQRRRRVCGEQRHCAGRERHLRRLCERAPRLRAAVAQRLCVARHGRLIGRHRRGEGLRRQAQRRGHGRHARCARPCRCARAGVWNANLSLSRGAFFIRCPCATELRVGAARSELPRAREQRAVLGRARRRPWLPLAGQPRRCAARGCSADAGGHRGAGCCLARVLLCAFACMLRCQRPPGTDERCHAEPVPLRARAATCAGAAPPAREC